MDTETLISELKKLTLEKDINGIESALSKLSNAENLQTDADLKETFVELLMQNTPSINLLVCKAIAEITKQQEQRAKFSNSEILEKLIELLGNNKNLELTIQLCRALGNIFFSNDDARNIVFHLDGGKNLVELFNISNAEIKDDERELFAKVRSGVVSNYLLGNEELSQKAIELGIIDKMKARMEESSDGLEHLLPLFSILTEQNSDLIFSPEVLTLITKILKTSNNPEIIESSLELLVCQSESDDVKLLLAREGLCEHIFNSLGTYKNLVGEEVEAKSLVKLGCDLIVLILTGDDAMHFLDKTPLLSFMKAWLDSDDMDLLTTSVLALGNFARTDDHCIRMVQENMHVKLIEILAKNNAPEADVRLQHALLSAIRNLVIPKQNKVAVIEAGLVATILPMLEIHQPPVVFKLLGTLRMLVDGQTPLALELLGNQKLIEQLVEWARKTPDMVGVNSESSRLMAWMIKNGYRGNSQDVTPLRVFTTIDGTVDTLVKMLLSAHLVMQNEALMALTLIVCNLADQKDQLSTTFISSSLGQTLVDFIQRISEMERTSNEIVENLNTLVSVLERLETVKKHLSEHNIEEKLKIFPRIQQLATL